MPRPPHVVIVDDEPEVLSGFTRLLRAYEPDYVISQADNGVRALAIVAAQRTDVVVTDLHMPVMDGFALLTQLERSHPETIRVVHSSHTATLATELLRYLAHNVLSKPTQAAEMLAVVRWAVEAAGAVRRQAAPY